MSTDARPRSLANRIELFVVQRLFRLPASAQLFLSGKPQVVVDGLKLDPEMQLLLSSRKRMGAPPLRAASADVARSLAIRETRRYASPALPLGRVEDLSIPSAGGSLAARHYVPDEPGGPHPLLVFFHGGGFVTGGIETHDEPCRLLCRHAGVHVLSVEYRLSPEHPFPAAVEDAEASFRWAVANAAKLGVDPARIGVGGDSAGGNLATVVAILTRGSEPTPAFQFLLYPPVDRTTRRPSHDHFADGFFLERADIEWFDRCYLGDRTGLADDERMSPAQAATLPNIPTVIVTAGFDPLRDEGEFYAERLGQAGVPVTFRRYPGMIHGFINMVSVSPAAREALIDTAALLRRLARTK